MRSLSALFLVLTAAVASAIAPNAATNLTAQAIANGAIKLTWQAPSTTGAPAADGYKVLRTTTASPGTPDDLTPTKITGLTFTDTTGVIGTSYTYTVVSYNGADAGNPSNAATATPKNLPGSPSGLRVTKITGDTVSLAWSAVNETGVTYKVQRDGADVKTGLTVTNYTDTGLDNNTEYTYTVTAVTTDGESGDSNEVTATTFGDGSKQQQAFAKRFRQIDVNADGLLSFDEYLAGHGGVLAWVVVDHRFGYSDLDGSGDLTLEEYAKALGGRRYLSPSKARQFYLADLDQDELLTIDEYTLTRGARTKQPAIEKSFDKLDKDHDGFLTPLEMKIRNYAPPQAEE